MIETILRHINKDYTIKYNMSYVNIHTCLLYVFPLLLI